MKKVYRVEFYFIKIQRVTFQSPKTVMSRFYALDSLTLNLISFLVNGLD